MSCFERCPFLIIDQVIVLLFTLYIYITLQNLSLQDPIDGIATCILGLEPDETSCFTAKKLESNFHISLHRFIGSTI